LVKYENQKIPGIGGEKITRIRAEGNFQPKMICYQKLKTVTTLGVMGGEVADFFLKSFFL
jgi:hypothetical protein